MTVPSLATVKNTTDVLDNAWVDAERAMDKWFRDDAPLFRHVDEVTLSAGDTTWVEAQFSDGAGAWRVGSPTINVGGFTAGTGGALGVIVPEDGYYDIELTGIFSPDSAGSRAIRCMVNGAGLAPAQAKVAAATQGNTMIYTGAPVLLNSGDEINLEAQQNSGNSMANSTFWLSIKWRLNG